MAHPDRLLRRSIRSRYVVTLDGDETFEGVLFDADERHLVLVDAASIARNGDRLAVDGQLWIPRPSVHYLQQIPTR